MADESVDRTSAAEAPPAADDSRGRAPEPSTSQPRSSSPRPEAYGGENLSKAYYRSPQFVGTVSAICFSAMGAYLGWVLPANILSIINEDIGPDPNINWIAISWTLCYSVSATLVGRLGDIFGRRWFMIGGNVLAVIAGILGATAQHVNQLIAAGCFLGLSSTFQLGFPIVIGELVPNKHRALANSLVFAFVLPASAFGTIIARALCERTALGWRWCYILDIIVSALALALYFFFYHPPSFDLLHTRHSKLQALKKTDFGGLVLFTAGLLLLLLGLSWGGQLYPWKSARVIACIVVGAVTLGLFGVYEANMPLEHPLVPMYLLKNGPFVAIVLCATVCSMIYYSINVIWPSEVTALFTTDSIEIGWLSTTIGAGTIAGEVAAGFFMKQIGKQRYQLMFSEACVTAFIGMLAAVTADRRALALAGTFIGSFFVGVVELLTLTMAPLTLDAEDIGLATGVLSSVRAAGGSIATAIYVTIYSNKLTSYIPRDVSPAVLAKGLPADSLPAFLTALTGTNATALAAVPGVNPTIIDAGEAALKTAYSDAFKIVYLATIAFGGCAVIASCFAPNLDHKMTGEVARKLQRVEPAKAAPTLDEEKAEAQHHG